MGPLAETRNRLQGWRAFLLAFLGIVLAELATNLRLGSGLLQDSFHIGEYFSAERTLDLGDFETGTIMIHGG